MIPSPTPSVIELKPPKDAINEVRLDGTELLALIRDALSVGHKLRTTSEPSLIDSKPCPPKSLLTLLAYCYVHGIYGSHQIEQRIRSDEALRTVANGSQPDHQLLTLFRRRNRTALQDCLKRVYWFIWAKYGIRDPEFRLAIDGSPGRRVRVSPEFSAGINAEASESASRAAFVDEMMAD